MQWILMSVYTTLSNTSLYFCCQPSTVGTSSDCDGPEKVPSRLKFLMGSYVGSFFLSSSQSGKGGASRREKRGEERGNDKLRKLFCHLWNLLCASLSKRKEWGKVVVLVLSFLERMLSGRPCTEKWIKPLLQKNNRTAWQICITFHITFHIPATGRDPISLFLTVSRPMPSNVYKQRPLPGLHWSPQHITYTGGSQPYMADGLNPSLTLSCMKCELFNF